MSTMTKSLVGVACAAIVAGGFTVAQASVISIPGNYMTTMPIYGSNGSMTGGDGAFHAGNNIDFPNNPSIADGNTSTGWGTGTNLNNLIFAVTAADGRKANGDPADPGFYAPDHFIQGSFGEINWIRIYVGTGGYQNNPPTQIAIHYSTSERTEASGAGWWGNSGINGSPGGSTYPNAVTITGVSGGAPVLVDAENDAYTIQLTSANYIPDGEGHQYVDLWLHIPSGATSLQFAVGKSGYNPSNPTSASFDYALSIYDVQASAIPEPASLGLIGVAGLGLLARRRRAH